MEKGMKKSNVDHDANDKLVCEIKNHLNACLFYHGEMIKNHDKIRKYLLELRGRVKPEHMPKEKVE